MVRPLRERPLHLAFVIAFGVFAFTSMTIDAIGGLGLDFAAVGHPLAGTLADYARDIDPLVTSGETWVQVMLFISGFVFGPLKLALAIGLARGWRWLPAPAITFCGAYIYSTVIYVAVGATVSPAPLLLALICAPYVLVPAALVVHLARAKAPFERAGSSPATPA